MYKHRCICRLCDSTDVSKVISLSETPAANSFLKPEHISLEEIYYPLNVYHCGNCGHLQLLDVVDQRELFDQYIYVSGTSSVMENYLKSQARRIIDKLKLAPGSLVVEFGANDGTFLRFFKQFGMKVVGVDPARNITKEIIDIPIITDFFDKKVAQSILSKYGHADLICAYNVCAHIDNLRGAIEGVSILLADKGQFVFEVGYLADVYNKGLFDTIYHEHLDYHRVEPLSKFFSSCDMTLVHTERSDIQGGALVGYVTKKDEIRSESVDLMIAEERANGLHLRHTYVDWSKMIDLNGQNILNLLRNIKGNGHTIAAYGAPAKATTLMHHYCIDSSIIDYIVDDNKLKQGTLTPGLHIPVKDPSYLYVDNPDFIIVLAWNFADSIIKNHAKMLDLGTKFIVPLPVIKVIANL